MVTGIRHCGIMTEELHKSVKFYNKLGLKIVYNKKENWGGSIGEINVVKMEAPDGRIFEITDQYKGSCDGNWGGDNYWGTHICFSVDSIENTLEKLKDVSYNTKPRLSPDKSVKVTFIYDPNGFKIELVENLC